MGVVRKSARNCTARPETPPSKLKTLKRYKFIELSKLDQNCSIMKQLDAEHDRLEVAVVLVTHSMHGREF